MKKSNHLIATIITLTPLSFSLAGCETTFPDPHPAIQVVQADAVTSCRRVGHFSSSAETPYGLFSDSVQEKNFSNAKIEANRLGATHIVLSAPVKDPVDSDIVRLNGLAYVCP